MVPPRLWLRSRSACLAGRIHPLRGINPTPVHGPGSAELPSPRSQMPERPLFLKGFDSLATVAIASRWSLTHETSP